MNVYLVKGRLSLILVEYLIKGNIMKVKNLKELIELLENNTIQLDHQDDIEKLINSLAKYFLNFDTFGHTLDSYESKENQYYFVFPDCYNETIYFYTDRWEYVEPSDLVLGYFEESIPYDEIYSKFRNTHHEEEFGFPEEKAEVELRKWAKDVSHNFRKHFYSLLV